MGTVWGRIVDSLVISNQLFPITFIFSKPLHFFASFFDSFQHPFSHHLFIIFALAQNYLGLWHVSTLSTATTTFIKNRDS